MPYLLYWLLFLRGAHLVMLRGDYYWLGNYYWQYSGVGLGHCVGCCLESTPGVPFFCVPCHWAPPSQCTPQKVKNYFVHFKSSLGAAELVQRWSCMQVQLPCAADPGVWSHKPCQECSWAQSQEWALSSARCASQIPPKWFLILLALILFFVAN